MTLDLHSSQEKFGGFLRSALDVLSQLLELATLHDIGKVRSIPASCVNTHRLSHLPCELALFVVVICVSAQVTDGWTGWKYAHNAGCFYI